ncbi:hypothetical protein [Nevskia ramosa]|uniref:hypothetical protein n=1 Tax=Nevskia ramosa TaxID=64002 RepID=UPI003D11422C
MKITTKIAYVPWWRPVRLVQNVSGSTFKFIGWVWREKAYMVHNVNYGWLAWIEDQTPERLDSCPSCHRPLTEPVAGRTMAEIIACRTAGMPFDPPIVREPYHTNPPPPAGVRKPAPPTPAPPASRRYPEPIE